MVLQTIETKSILGSPSPGFLTRLLSTFRNHIKVSWREVVCRTIAISIGLFVVFPSMYMLLERSPVLTVKNLRVDPSEVQGGDYLTLRWNATDHRSNCEGVISESITDSSGRIYYYAPVYASHHPATGIELDYTKEMKSPTNPVKGPATYRSHIVRSCNSLQKYFWPLKEDDHVAKFNFI